MKIRELKLTSPTSDKPISGYIQNKNISYINNGVQAMVYAHKKKPNSVIKIISIEGTNDPAYQFLRICVNHPDNPYLPKIFAHKIYKTEQMTAADIENLENNPIFDFEPEQTGRQFQLFLVVERLQEFPLAHLQDFLKQVKLYPLVNMFAEKRNTTLDIGFRIMFQDAKGRSMLRQYTDDKNFSNALRLLEPIFAKHDADVHIGNLMLRGNQTVLNDPVTRLIDDFVR